MSLHDEFALTVAAFLQMVPSATRESGASGNFILKVDKTQGTVLLRRASLKANQIHPVHGHPVVAHLPGEDGQPDKWVVLSLRDIIEYAVTHPGSRQHTTHALECLMMGRDDIERFPDVPPPALLKRVEDAIRESRRPAELRAVRMIERAQTLSLTFLQQAADDAAHALGIIP